MKKNLKRSGDASRIPDGRKNVKTENSPAKAGRKTITKMDEDEDRRRQQQLAVPGTVLGFEDERDEGDGGSGCDTPDKSRAQGAAGNVTVPRPPKSAKKRTRRRPPEKYAEYAAYRGHTTSWAVLTKLEKQQLALRAIAESVNGTVKCLNEKCTRALKTIEDVVDHVDKCLKLPEYFKYMGKADVFRALDKATKARILRVSMNALQILPCLNIETLNCTQKYGHRYALSYHLERCGQERDQLPWKCWKCGFATTVAEGRLHLPTCPNPKTRRKEERSEDESDSENSGVEGSDGGRKAKNNRLKLPSIAKGYLPERSSRMKVADGVKRFKFKSANLEANAPSPRELLQYQQTVDRANELLNARREKESLCNKLSQFEHYSNNFKRIAPRDFGENLSALLDKCSIPVVLPPEDSEEQQPASSGDSKMGVRNVCRGRVNDCKQRLPVFQPKPLHCRTKKLNFISAEKDIHEIGCIAYCGGPISTIKGCPRILQDGRECVAVTAFSDEEYLISRNQNGCHDYVQFWLYDNKPERIAASLWFLLEVDLSNVLCTAWCPSLRGSVKENNKLPSFVGILALGGVKGSVLLYGIRNDIPIPSTSDDEPVVYRSKPELVLASPECCSEAPIISIAWSENEGASRFTAVSASGRVLIWNLNESTLSARIIHSSEWLSPPLGVAFCGSEQLAVSFREKLIRIYDLTTLAFVVEESAQRTAGMQVCSRERLFSGIFSYQQDFTLTGMHLTCGTCYVVLGSSKENFFVVPLANKHEIQLCDMCICPRTGAIISVGADGRLQISLSGRLAAHGSEKDFQFGTYRVVMTLLRKNEEVPLIKSEEPDLNVNIIAGDDTECKGEAKLPPPLTNLELCAEKSHIEFSFEDIKNNKTAIPQFSLDIRTESLNRLAVSEPSGRLAICGGEAGLLIFLPCYLR